MAKIKFDKESLQGFFFHHTEKIVLAVVLLLLGLFIWSGSSLEGIGAQNPAELAKKVDAAAEHIEVPTWDNIKDEYTPSLDHVERKQIGDAATSEVYYPLDKPLTGTRPPQTTPRSDPEIFKLIEPEATVVTGPLALKMRDSWTDPFADLENMEQKKIEAKKKRSKKKKKSGGADSMYGEGMMEGGMDEMMEEYGGGSGDEMFGGEGMYGMGGGTASGPSVRADADKFPGYRPTTTAASVIGKPANVVSVKVLVPYQQQWDEFERVFRDAADYRPARDVPTYLSFRAQRAEVPDDPTQELKWGYIAWTERVLDTLPKMGLAGFPGEIADSKYLLPGVLTMPVPPLMMRDLSDLALHSKVPMQEEAKNTVVEREAPELVDVEDLGGVAEIDDIPTTPAARRPTAGYGGGEGMYGGGGEGMYGGGGEGMYGGGGEGMYGGGGEGMYGGGGEGMYGGGMSTQQLRGPQAEFLMVRFFDFSARPGKKYVYRVQVVLEDPNHPQDLRMQPDDRALADTVRTRLAKVAEDEAAQTAKKKTPIRLATLTTEWSDPTSPVSVEIESSAFAGGVKLPRMQTLASGVSGNNASFSVPVSDEPTIDVMSLGWSAKYAADMPAIMPASRGSMFRKQMKTDVIDPVSLIYKTIPDHPVGTGELVLDMRGGEVVEQPEEEGAKPILAPGEVALIDSSGNFVVRNELDDWQAFDKYAPPAPIVVEAAAAADDMYGDDGGYGDFGSMYGEGE